MGYEKVRRPIIDRSGDELGAAAGADAGEAAGTIAGAAASQADADDAQAAAIAAAAAAALVAHAPKTKTLNTGAAAYALVVADAGTIRELSGVTGRALTVPTNAAQAIPVGTEIVLLQRDAGAWTVTPVDGTVTIEVLATKTLVTGGAGARAVLTKRAANVWNLSGDLTSV